MQAIETIKKQISIDMHDTVLSDVCMRIVNYLETTPVSQLKHITYHTLYSVSNSSNEDVLLLAIQYLAGSKLQIIQSEYELFEDGFPIQLDKSYVAEANRVQCFAHPETGEIIEDYQSKITLYFTVSEKFQELVN